MRHQYNSPGADKRRSIHIENNLSICVEHCGIIIQELIAGEAYLEELIYLFVWSMLKDTG